MSCFEGRSVIARAVAGSKLVSSSSDAAVLHGLGRETPRWSKGGWKRCGRDDGDAVPSAARS